MVRIASECDQQEPVKWNTIASTHESTSDFNSEWSLDFVACFLACADTNHSKAFTTIWSII